MWRTIAGTRRFICAIRELNRHSIGFRRARGQECPRHTSLAGHQLLDLLWLLRQGFSEADQLAILVHVEHILDAHTELFFGNVNSRLDGEDHAGAERRRILADVVDIESDVVPETVDKVFAQRLAV